MKIVRIISEITSLREFWVIIWFLQDIRIDIGQNISLHTRHVNMKPEFLYRIFCIWWAAFRKWFFDFSAVFHSVHVEHNFPIFWIFPMAFKRMETASRFTFNWSTSYCCVWASFSSNNACNSLSWNFFGGLPRSSFLTSKLPLLNFLNHSKHYDLPRACSP